MKVRLTLATIVIVVCALVATALPAGAKPAPKPSRPGSGAGLEFTPTGIASFALEKALGAGASQAGTMIIKSLGLNTLFPDPTEEALKRIESQLNGIKTQITDVQKNLNQVKAYIVEQSINEALRTIQDRWTDVLDLYNRFFLKVLDEAQHVRDVKDDPASTPADIATAQSNAIKARDDFYRQFDAGGYGGMVGQFHNRIVPSQGTTLMKLQGRELLITKRFLTSADSRILRNTFDVIAEQEALLAWMKMERTAKSDRSAYDGAPAPGTQRDYDNSREEFIRNSVEEAQYLPPAIPPGVVVDVGALDRPNTDNATVWAPATDTANLAYGDATAGPNRVSDALASARANYLGTFNDWQVPTRAQVDGLVTAYKDSSEPFFRNFLTDLNPNDTGWQSIQTRGWNTVWARDAQSRTVACNVSPPRPNDTVVVTADVHPSITLPVKTPAWTIRPTLDANVLEPGTSPQAVCDSYLARQFDGARGGLLLARSTGVMPMDYMAQKGGATLRPGANLRGADLTDLNLVDTDLTGADLSGARLAHVSMSVDEVSPQAPHRSTVLANARLGDVSSGGIIGAPSGLPSPWRLMSGYLIGPGANLQQARLAGFDLTSVPITGVRSGNTDCTGCTLPPNWRWIGGFLIGPTANLQSAELSRFDLSGLDLAGANLTAANMTQGTNLTGANLFGANLYRARMPVARLANADFTDANLTQANLTGANAAPANFTGANLTEADLDGVNAVGAKFVNTTLTDTRIQGLFVATGADFTGAILTRADWQLSDLSNARLAATTVTGAHLIVTLTGVSSGEIVGTFAANGLPPGWRLVAGYLVGPGANLRNADFGSQNLTGLDLSGLDLTGANLGRANLTNATLRDTNLRGVVLTGATITGATFTTLNDHLFGGVVSGGLVGTPRALPNERFRIVQGFLVGPTVSLAGTTFPATAQLGTALTGTDFTGAVLTGINFTGAQMTQATLAGTTLTNTNLTRVNLARANLAGVVSGGIVGAPSLLPEGWRVVNGYLVGPEAELRQANLAGADLTGVNLAGALLAGANLTGAKWSNTTCPNGITQSTPCSAAIAGTSTTINVAASRNGDALVGDVEPDLHRGDFTFRVETVSEAGGWIPVQTYTTKGSDETWNIDLPAGTYRVVLLPQLGYSGATSAPVVLTK
jgi:uncharacterized protein YjbI with pentapeptide repeats